MAGGLDEILRVGRRRARRAAMWLQGRRIPPVVQAVHENGLTYLGEKALLDLHDQVRRVEDEQLEGRLIEAGCALGGSAIVIAAAKARERPLYVYDVFDMIPPPTEQDGQDVHDRYRIITQGESRGINGATYYGYRQDLYAVVEANFAKEGVPVGENNVYLVQGLFQDTLQVGGPVALAHIDGDWYESVMTCLARIAPRLIPGGVLIIDDYDCWSGCRKAVDEYFSDKMDDYVFVRRSRLQIFRK